MTTDLSTVDLATLNIASEVVVTALRNHVCQWEHQSADAVADGRLSNAVMLEHWAFAADLLAGVASGEITRLFIQVLDARLDNPIGAEKASSAQEELVVA